MIRPFTARESVPAAAATACGACARRAAAAVRATRCSKSTPPQDACPHSADPSRATGCGTAARLRQTGMMVMMMMPNTAITHTHAHAPPPPAFRARPPLIPSPVANTTTDWQYQPTCSSAQLLERQPSETQHLPQYHTTVRSTSHFQAIFRLLLLLLLLLPLRIKQLCKLLQVHLLHSLQRAAGAEDQRAHRRGALSVVSVSVSVSVSGH